MNKLTFGKSFKVRNVIIDKHTRLIPLALTRLDTPNIFRYTLLLAILILEKVVYVHVQKENSIIPCRNSYTIQCYTIQCLLHLLNSLTRRLDLPYSSTLIYFKISASSQLLLVKIKPKYLIESAYKIGKEFINSGSNDYL